MPTASFTVADALALPRPVFIGSRWYPAGSNYVSYTPNSTIRFQVVGTDCAIYGGSPGPPNGFYCSVDGGAVFNVVFSGSSAPIFSGLSDGVHRVEITVDNQSMGNVGVRQTGGQWLDVTGASPSFAADDYFGPFAHVQGGGANVHSTFVDDPNNATNTPHVGADYGLASAAVVGNAVSVWVFAKYDSNNPTQFTLEVDGWPQTPVAQSVPPNGFNWGWTPLPYPSNDINHSLEFRVVCGQASDVDMIVLGGAPGATPQISSAAFTKPKIIFAFGDSITNATLPGFDGSNRCNGYYYALSKFLGTKQWNARCCGHPGANTAQLVTHMTDDLANQWTDTADLIILYVGRNDWGSTSTQGQIDTLSTNYQTILNGMLPRLTATGRIAACCLADTGFGLSATYVNQGIRAAVAAVNNPKIVLVDLETLYQVQTVDSGTHPDVRGHATLANAMHRILFPPAGSGGGTAPGNPFGNRSFGSF